MNLDRFKDNVISLMSYPNGDDKFAALRVQTHGMASARLAKTINFAVKCLDKDEFYVEIGTFTGFTLISAGYENTQSCIGIDDLSCIDFFGGDNIDKARENVRIILKNNLSTFGRHNLSHVESDFRKVVFDESNKKKMGILLIDGKHTEEEVNETLAWADPYLSYNSLIFFDDVVMGTINKSICDLWKRGGELLYYAATKNHHEVTGYGVAIMAIKRDA